MKKALSVNEGILLVRSVLNDDMQSAGEETPTLD